MFVTEWPEDMGCVFWDEWIKVTGCDIPGDLGVMRYWLNNGGYNRQAG